MRHIEMLNDAYPEQLMGLLRDEIRRAELAQQARDAAARRRRERWARLRAWFEARFRPASRVSPEHTPD